MERQKREQEQQRKSDVLLNVSHNLDRPLLKAVDETTPQEMPTMCSIVSRAGIVSRGCRKILSINLLCSDVTSLAMMQLFEQCDMLQK